MRKIFLFLAFLFSSASAEVYQDMDTAVRAAIYTQKPLMVVVMQTTCPHCKNYWDNTLNAQGVMQRLTSEFVILQCYIDSGCPRPTDLPWTGTVPTTYFLTPRGEMIGDPLVGAISLDRFIPYVSQLIDYVYQTRDAAIRGGAQ